MTDPNASFSPEDFGLDDAAALAPEADGAAAAEKGGSTPQKMDQDSHGDGKFVDFSRMKMVLDVPLKVSVELGRTKLLINDLLQLGQGSVIELDKMAGEPMEIYVNDKLVALGEVVVVNEKFGIRLTDIMSGIGIEEMTPRDMA
jgi:flagellar motor switch protein FliN/FliY